MSLIAAVLLATAAHRNPFLFVEKPKPQPKPVERRASSPPAAVVVAPEETGRAGSPPSHEDEAVPAFPYQLIGRFGRNDDPIVAFVGKGQVITVQSGDVIEDAFVVKRIGVESVEIGFVNRAETLTIRLQ